MFSRESGDCMCSPDERSDIRVTTAVPGCCFAHPGYVLFCVLPILLGSVGSALAQDEVPTACRPEDSCPPSPAHDGICEHPSFDGTASYPFSGAYEKRCILRAKPFVVRRGDALRLTFRNGKTRVYQDNWNAKACEQGPYEAANNTFFMITCPNIKSSLSRSSTSKATNGC